MGVKKPIPPGTKVGKLTVIREYDYVKGKGYRYLCQCSCEEKNTVIAYAYKLRTGKPRSCGCLTKESSTLRRTHMEIGSIYGRLTILKELNFVKKVAITIYASAVVLRNLK